MIIEMILFQSFPLILLFLIPSSFVFAQTTSYYTAYQKSFPYVTSCPINQYFDTALLQCSNCPNNAQQKSGDSTQCDCTSTSYYYGVNQGGGSLICTPCANANYVRSIDGFGCTSPTGSTCNSVTSNSVLSEAQLDGSLYSGISSSSNQPRVGSDTCVPCQPGTWPDPDSQRCAPCASATPLTGAPPSGATITCCTASQTFDGVCLQTSVFPRRDTLTFMTQNRYSSPSTSSFFEQHLKASYFLCQMNLNVTTVQSSSRLLLSNATACQVLGNIAAMQFFYDGTNYAYWHYDNTIWYSTDPVWRVTDNRTSIPFLAYPTTYYDEITSSTYSWIPASFNQNDLVRLKLAKYSPTGQFLGRIDAYDTYIQLCGGGYTQGRAAFTFGIQYKSSCFIRADALWNSPLYDTAFFDPYIVFTRSGVDYMLPTPVVITNYETITATHPNQNSDESKWTYHRRFFLLDRISGIVNNNTLKNVHYAKSIKILNTLTNDGSYIQPPVVVVEYGELSTSDIGTGTIVEVKFESDYRMNLDTHIRDIWIAVGVLAGLGLLLAFARTTVWQSRSGKAVIELLTIGKLFVYITNILGTVFFIVMGGVSLWWLIFFKRQDAIYLVIPTSAQQASFTALVSVAFALKMIDILHLIFRQGTTDIFFIDWEKPKGGTNNVSVWRTYFVANEFHEIQIFRRINLTFQLFFVLFLLKVINLENVATAQPGVNLFPSSSDYTPEYNGILRVGIAFSMWLATALVQYLFYILFYQRFVEDRIINFIDLCSVSNISVFILTDNLYGYYIHGRSPHGATDVNLRDMIMNLEREANQMIGARGLDEKSMEQTFIIRLDLAFRAQYTVLLESFQNRMQNRITRKGDEHEAEIKMKSYRELNEFLCAFINHSLPTYNYIVRDRLFLEQLLNYEFVVPTPPIGQPGQNVNSIFFVDKEKNFTNSMFAGHENSLLIWNMIVFLFVDYFAFNYVLAAIITYILNLIAVKMRLSLGRKNLSDKTLIPKNFLI